MKKSQFLLLRLLFFVVSSSQSATAAAATSSNQHFWLSVELDAIRWREGCLTTALCSQPRFQLVKDLLPVSERVSVNWPISEHFVKDSVHPFISYWPSGRVEDISLSAQVVGTDRTYGFPRVCDQTPSIRVFPESHQKRLTSEIDEEMRASATTTTTPTTSQSMKLHIKGKCFNATLSIVKHVERCPWCPDPSEVNIIQQESSEVTDRRMLTASGWTQIFADERFVHFGVLILAVVAVAASAAFAVVLVMYLRNKRLIKETSKKARFHPYISVKGHEIDETNRYDMPWEQHNRPLTYWMTSSNKSDSTMTSPLDSASSLANSGATTTTTPIYTRDGYQTYRQPPPPPPPPPSLHPPMFPPQTQIYHQHHHHQGFGPQPPSRHVTSPLSTSRADDSGLESV